MNDFIRRSLEQNQFMDWAAMSFGDNNWHSNSEILDELIEDAPYGLSLKLWSRQAIASTLGGLKARMYGWEKRREGVNIWYRVNWSIYKEHKP